METTMIMLKESKGLTLVDPYIPAYMPDPQLEKFCKDEKQFFFSPGDTRLRPRERNRRTLRRTQTGSATHAYRRSTRVSSEVYEGI
jgi:hypothetical protein